MESLVRFANKVLLIDSMKHLLPSEVYDRPKKGFTFPFEEWIRKELPSDVRDLFFIQSDIFDKKQINKL